MSNKPLFPPLLLYTWRASGFQRPSCASIFSPLHYVPAGRGRRTAPPTPSVVSVGEVRKSQPYDSQWFVPSSMWGNEVRGGGGGRVPKL